MNELDPTVERPHVVNLAEAHSRLRLAMSVLSAAQTNLTTSATAYLRELVGDEALGKAQFDPRLATPQQHEAMILGAKAARATLDSRDYAPVRDKLVGWIAQPKKRER